MTKKQLTNKLLKKDRQFISELEEGNRMVERHQLSKAMRDYLAVEWWRLDRIIARHSVSWLTLGNLTTGQYNLFLRDVSNLIYGREEKANSYRKQAGILH